MANESSPYSEFELVSSRAAGFELKIRLLADLAGTTSKISVDGTLDQLITSLQMHYSQGLTVKEWALLDLSRKLRNKLFHGELHKACELIGVPPGGVVCIDISPYNEPEEILNAINSAQSGAPGRLVSGTTTKNGGIFGWLLETNSNGGFAAMLTVFEKLAMSKGLYIMPPMPPTIY